MSVWMKSDTKQMIDTSTTGITVAGTYYLMLSCLDPRRPVLFGAQTKVAGHAATVQMFAEVATVKIPIGAPDLPAILTPAFGAPVAYSDEITLTGPRLIVITDLVGAVYPEVSQ